MLANKQQETGIQVIEKNLSAINVRERFNELVGRHATEYLGMMILEASRKPELQKCTVSSLYRAAMKAAILRLEIGTEIYVIPYYNKKIGKHEASTITSYKGLYRLAMRGMQYRYINVAYLYRGQRLDVDKLTGRLIGIEGEPTKEKEKIGVFAVFEMVNNFQKYEYMSLEELEEHRQRYAKANGKFWDEYPEIMQKKTVLRRLLDRWGVYQITEQQEQYLSDEVLPDVEMPEPKQIKSDEKPEQIMAELGYGTSEPEQAKPQRPYTPEQVKKGIIDVASKGSQEPATFSDIQNISEKLMYVIGENEPPDFIDRFIAWLGQKPTKGLMQAIEKWLSVTVTESGEILVSRNVVSELQGIAEIL